MQPSQELSINSCWSLIAQENEECWRRLFQSIIRLQFGRSVCLYRRDSGRREDKAI